MITSTLPAMSIDCREMQAQFHTNRKRGVRFVAPSSFTLINAMIFILLIHLESLDASTIPEGLNNEQKQQAHVTTTASDMRQISKRHTSEKDFAPKLIHQPQSVLVQPNKPHTIECPVEAKPEAEVKWFKDRQLLVSQPAHLEQTGSELMFFQVNNDDTGDYYCQATNYLGSTESEKFRLTVQSNIHGPRIGLEPALAEVGADQQVEFTCSIPSATSSRQKSQQQAQQQAPEVGWRRNGKRLEVKWLEDGEGLQEARARFVARQVGPSEFVLTITRVQLKDDNATFTCLFTPERAQDGAGLEPGAADFSSSSSSSSSSSLSDSSSDGQLAHESSPAKLRVYALDHRQKQQEKPANVATPDGHVKLDVNLAPPIDNLVSNGPHEIQQQPEAAANHTTQLSHQHPRSRANTTLKQALEDLYEISKPMLVICGLVMLVLVGPALLYISRRTGHQNRYMKHHQFGGCGGGSAGSGASNAIGALGAIDCHDPVLNSLMARTLSAPSGASLVGGGPAAVAAALNGKKYRSYRDHMRKVAAANEAAAAVGCNDLVDGYFAAAVAAAAAAQQQQQQQQQQHPTTVGDHNSAAAAANSFFAAANSTAALPNLYNQSLAAREQARSLLQASEHMRSLSNLSHVAAQQKHQQQLQHSRLGQNGSHLNLPLSFAFGNPVTTSNTGQTNGRANGEQASSAAPGAARLIDGAAQLMASALWPPHLAHLASGRGANHNHQQQATAGLLASCQPSRTLQSDEHYQLVNCSSISPSSSSSIVGSNSSSNPRDSHLRQLQGARDSSSLNHYSTIENNEDDEDRYEEIDHNQNASCDPMNNNNTNTDGSGRVRAQTTSDAANARRQESFRISRTSTFGSNNGGVGNLVADQQQRHVDGNQRPSSLRSSFISSSNSSSSGCGDSTNTSSSLASDAFSRFGLKQRGSRQNKTRSGRQQGANDQLSPYAVSSICGSVPQPQVPPPPMSSEAMRALDEQFDINQLMLIDESATMTNNNNQDGLIGFNAPPPPQPTENSTVDSIHKAAKEASKKDNLRLQANRGKLAHDQQ